MVANYTEATALPHKMIEKEVTQEHRCPFPDSKFLFKGKRWIPSERVNHFAHHIFLNHVREDEETFVADVRDQPACGWCGSRKGKCKTVPCKNTNLEPDVPVVWETCQENYHLCQKH